MFNITDLYHKMVNNPDLSGHFDLKKDRIEWFLSDRYSIIICDDYLEIRRLVFGKFWTSLTHWHPDDKDMYSDICNIGTKGNVTVIHRTPLLESVLYSGPCSGCKYKRKWLFGKYYYIYALKT